MNEWFLVVDPVPLKGSLNMAIDEFLFSSLGEKLQTFVRFYQWERPTVSLGYLQNFQKVVDLDYCQSHGIDIVRRMTGGKLVLHHKEVTYSLSSSDRGIFTASVANSYKLISQGLMRGLEKMELKPMLASSHPSTYARGNSLCFSHPARDEIEIGGKKIIGSAQRRVGSKFIQHGSIPLEHDEELLKSVSFSGKGESQIRMTSLSQALGRNVSFEWAVDCFVGGISEYFGINFKPKIFTDSEREAIARIQKAYYENEAWTFLGSKISVAL